MFEKMAFLFASKKNIELISAGVHLQNRTTDKSAIGIGKNYWSVSHRSVKIMTQLLPSSPVAMPGNTFISCDPSGHSILGQGQSMAVGPWQGGGSGTLSLKAPFPL